MKKRLVAFILAIAAVAAIMTGCGKTEPAVNQPVVSSSNPIQSMTQEEMMEQTGLNIAAPAEATDVMYSVIDGDSKIAQVDLKLNGQSGTIRACTEDIPEGELKDISGLNFEWSNNADVTVGYNDAKAYWNEDGIGYVTWYDLVPGILYSVSMGGGANEQSLAAFAEAVYVPMQGDSDGDDQTTAATTTAVANDGNASSTEASEA